MGFQRPGMLMALDESTNRRSGLLRDRRGVSPVLGTSMLIMATISLASIFLVAADDLTPVGAPPVARIKVTEAGYGIFIEHGGGADLPAGEVIVRIEVAGRTTENELSDFPGVGGTFSAGERVKIIGIDYSKDDTIKVELIHRDSRATVFKGHVTASRPSWSGWYDPRWRYRKKITIDHTKVEDELREFPLTVILRDPDLALKARSDGGDILFTGPDGERRIPHEIESYDGSTGELVAHVKVPRLSSKTDTKIYMYYGNPDAPSQGGTAEVWDSYEGVWHLSESFELVPGVGVATQAAMDGGNGGWAVLFGPSPVTSDIDLAIDEDQMKDPERNHTTEQVGYWAFAEETVIKDSSGKIIGEIGRMPKVGSSWVEVKFSRSYFDPVVIATYDLPDAGCPPAVTRIRSVTDSSFEVMVQGVGKEAPIPSDVHYLVIEAGAHTLPGGTSLEAGYHKEDGVNHSGNWSSKEMTKLELKFERPVVLGQVMSYEDPRWQVFWCSDGTQGGPPAPGKVWVGRHVGEDPDTSRCPELIGWIVVDAGEGSVDGVDWKADLGSDAVRGVDDAPPYSYHTGVGEGTDNIFLDSTSNGYHAGYRGSPQTRVAGKIGYAVSFGGGDYLPLWGKRYASQGEISELTVSVWVKSFSGCKQIISSFDRSEYWRLALKDDTGTNNVAFDTRDSAGKIHDLTTSADYADDRWHYVCVWFKAGASPDKKIFVDGKLVAGATAHGGKALGSGVGRYGFIGVGSEAGSYDGPRGPELYMRGIVDEHRISEVARSEGWIATVYNNQSSPETFYSVGQEETIA